MNWEAFFVTLAALPIFVWIAPYAFMAGMKTAVWWLKPERAPVRRFAEWVAAVVLLILSAAVVGVIAA